MNARNWLENNKNSSVPLRELEILIEHVCSCSRMELYLDEIELDARQEKKIAKNLEQRKNGRPVQYIIGEVQFADLTLKIDERVLIPRPETEWIVDRILALESRSDLQVLDLGTGSGCIALSLKSQRPSWKVCGVDKSMPALELATSNAELLDLEVNFSHGDLDSSDFKTEISVSYVDVLVSNPPYIPLVEKSDLQIEVQGHEPHEALFAGNDPQHFYRHLARLGSNSLKPGGRIYLECHEEFALGTRKLFSDAGYTHLEIEVDLNKKPRLLRGRWEN